MDDKSKKGSITLKFDYRIVSAVLLVIIVGMLAFWQPWNRTSDRTVEVTGEATLKAEPDEFVFSHSYEFKNADKQAALSDLSKKSDEVIAKLKELGVADSQIKTNSSGYDYPYYKDGTSTPTYTLSLTITLASKDMAQKVQDYLVGTSPTGSVSPQATFSETKRKELESQARDQATKDARTKADQSAKNLGFSVGAVKTVNDGAGFGGIAYPTMRGLAEDSLKLSIQPGENDLNYSVTVVYFIY